jgi:alpha-L-fucosidase
LSLGRVGTESGFAGNPCWATIDSFSIRDESAHLKELNQGEIDGDAYIPAESDVSLRPSWFNHASEDGQAKSVSQLWDIYCGSVGHNSVLLLNFSPDRRGLITADDSTKANGLRRMIEGTFKTNLASGAKVTSLPRKYG